jgi:subtilisin family serine protease
MEMIAFLLLLLLVYCGKEGKAILDRIDQRFGYDRGEYNAAKYSGRGITIITLDSGIYMNHSEFRDNKRIQFVNFVEDDGYQDCFGHGTALASVIIGKTLGIARESDFISLRIANCQGSSSIITFLRAVEWIEDYQLKYPNKKYLILLAIVSEKNDIINRATKKLYKEHKSYVIQAAGNYFSNACNYSPASESTGITIGSLTLDETIQPRSNYGPCVNYYMISENIRCANAFPITEYKTVGGTSAASAVATGVIAIQWQKNIKNKRFKPRGYVIRSPYDLDCKSFVNGYRSLLAPLSTVRKLKLNETYRGDTVRDFVIWRDQYTIKGVVNFKFSSEVREVLFSTYALPLGFDIRKKTICLASDWDWVLLKQYGNRTLRIETRTGYKVEKENWDGILNVNLNKAKLLVLSYSSGVLNYQLSVSRLMYSVLGGSFLNF